MMADVLLLLLLLLVVMSHCVWTAMCIFCSQASCKP
jgi:hypothetical protein